MTSTSLAERPRSTPHRLALRGDESELYRTHSRALLGRTRRAVKAPKPLIEDACQLAWLQLIRYQPEPRENVLAWLTVVARREAYRLLLDYRRATPASDVVSVDEEGRREALDIDELRAAERDPLGPMQMRELLAAMAALRPAQRRALALKVAGFSYKEIQLLCGGKTYTWVNRHITEGRAALRERVAASE